MSKLNSRLRSTAMLATSAAALALTACAGHSQNARYGNVYDYESGSQCATQGCGAVAAAPMVESTRYAETYSGGYTDNVVYADCSVVSGMNCNAQPVQVYETYPAPVTTYPTATTYPTDTITYGGGYSTGETAACPAGTTAAGDGTCMQSSGGYDSYSSGSTTSTGYTDSYSSGGSYSTGGYTGGYTGSTSLPAECPSGTSAQSDGTCMQSGSGYDSYSSGSSYTGTTSTYTGSTYGGTTTGTCPAGSSMASDGTCAMNEGSSYGGYTSTGTTYTTNDYMPVRK